MSFFTKDDCSIHIGGSVGEHYIELGIANAKLEALGTDPLTTYFREECERLRGELAELRREFHKTRPVGAAEIDNIKLHDLLRSFRDHYDCDKDAHAYGTKCRACAARAALAGKKDAP